MCAGPSPRSVLTFGPLSACRPVGFWGHPARPRRHSHRRKGICVRVSFSLWRLALVGVVISPPGERERCLGRLERGISLAKVDKGRHRLCPVCM